MAYTFLDLLSMYILKYMSELKISIFAMKKVLFKKLLVIILFRMKSNIWKKTYSLS